MPGPIQQPGKVDVALASHQKQIDRLTRKLGAGGDSEHNGTGANSTAVGTSTTAAGDSATSVGDNAAASANDSTSVGTDTIADAEGASAFAWASQAHGPNSLALGAGCVTSVDADRSISIGYNMTVSHPFSMGVGWGLTPDKAHQAVFNYGELVVVPITDGGAVSTTDDSYLVLCHSGYRYKLYIDTSTGTPEVKAVYYPW